LRAWILWTLEVLAPAINTKNNNHAIEMYPDKLAEQAAMNSRHKIKNTHLVHLALSHFTLQTTMDIPTSFTLYFNSLRTITMIITG
jgi:hypothetical protein